MKANDKSKPNNSLNSLNEDNNITACSCPKRLLRKGDIVQEVRVNNRRHGTPWRPNRLHELAVVFADEAKSGTLVEVLYTDKMFNQVDVAYLKLVVPIEERSLYYIHECISESSFEICRKVQDETVSRMAYFWSSDSCYGELTKKEAFDLAKTECDRLNEELINNPCVELKNYATLAKRPGNET